MARNYMSLNINERINLKSHKILPLEYYYKNDMLDKNIEMVFNSFRIPVSDMLEMPQVNHFKFGMSVMPSYMELYTCECLFGKTYDPHKSRII